MSVVEIQLDLDLHVFDRELFLRTCLRNGLEVPVVEWTGEKVHRLVQLDEDGEGLTACGRRILEDVVDLVGCARSLSRPRPCLNCHRSERRNP